MFPGFDELLESSRQTRHRFDSVDEFLEFLSEKKKNFVSNSVRVS